MYHNYRAGSSPQGGCTTTTGRGPVRRGGVPQLQGGFQSVGGVYHNYRAWSSPQGGVYYNYRAWCSAYGGCTTTTGRGPVRRGGVPELQGVVQSVGGVYQNYRACSGP